MSRTTITDYYIKAFQKLESKGKDSWNWSAMLCTSAWLFYRKMYLYVFLLAVFDVGVLLLGIGNIITAKMVVSILLGISVVEMLFLGYYGNRLYYRTVKKRIAEGYHLLDNYHPFSISSAFVSAMIFVPLGILLRFFNIGVGIFATIYALADWSVNKWHRRKLKSVSNTEVSEKNIRQYLTYGNRNHLPGQIVAVLCVCISIISSVSIVIGAMSNEKKLEASLIQTNNVSEKIAAKK